MGYDNWADYRIEIKMAKNGKTAWDFLQRLNKGLAPKFKEELETFARLKAKETGNADARINYWDVGYYKHQLTKTRYQVDKDKLKVYFELENTLNGMFSIFEELFGIRIEPVEAPYKWIDDLRLYAVSDASSGAPMGLIYMDMFPRDGKYNHFAQFDVTPQSDCPTENTSARWPPLSATFHRRATANPHCSPMITWKPCSTSSATPCTTC